MVQSFEGWYNSLIDINFDFQYFYFRVYHRVVLSNKVQKISGQESIPQLTLIMLIVGYLKDSSLVIIFGFSDLTYLFWINSFSDKKKSKVPNKPPVQYHRMSGEFQPQSGYFHHHQAQHHHPQQAQFQSLHNIWPELSAPAPISRRPPMRNSNSE